MAMVMLNERKRVMSRPWEPSPQRDLNSDQLTSRVDSIDDDDDGVGDSLTGFLLGGFEVMKLDLDMQMRFLV